jgi:diketogulonate reductase-like aldo/keto reductase
MTGFSTAVLGKPFAMTSTTTVPNVALHDGTEIPQLGFGVFQVPPEDTFEVVTDAIEVGYRHIDTAKAYGNEAQVGQAIKASGLDRSEFYVTTKCFNSDHGYDQAKNAFKTSLDRLELDYIDLYLIHWPVPAKDKYVETWKAFIELEQEPNLRSIGVSNFQADHLRRIIDETGVTPVVNQIELHPYLQQAELRGVHAERNIVTEAWSPLAQGEVLDDAELKAIADDHGVTPGQVVLRWHIQLGNVVFPKSVTPERIEENFDIFGFELSEEEMRRIEALDKNERIGPDPDTFVSP